MKKQLQLIQPSYSVERIVNRAVKKILDSPEMAAAELIANAWDAAATDVKIIWPSEGVQFCIEDNGRGMSLDEFKTKWANIGYEKIAADREIRFSVDGKEVSREAYGKNGLGKYAIFCFGEEATIETARDGTKHTFTVTYDGKDLNITNPIEEDSSWHGTKITITRTKSIRCPEDVITSYISQRFFTLPFFEISVNGNSVGYDSIPESCKKLDEDILVPDIGTAHMTILRKEEKDTTIRWSGVLWRIQKRALGKSLTWKDAGFGDIVDGRTDEGKGFIIIIDADMLSLEENDIYWEKIDTSTEEYKQTHAAIHTRLKDFFAETLKDRQQSKIESVKRATAQEMNLLPRKSKKKVDDFIQETVVQCPSISTNDLNNLVKILATIETTNEKFAILAKLATLNRADWENLSEILKDWTIEMAKAVLDEISERLKLIETLRKKVKDPDTLEVQDLQPLMERCLWMLGPEFESIEYTSNENIASCVRKILHAESPVPTSRNRPDFVVLPNRALSFYSTFDYDDFHESTGIAKLVILELKAPSVSIGREEKSQPLKYCDELRSIGAIQDNTKVYAYVLGSKIQKTLNPEPTRENNCVVHVMLFDMLLSRAENRMFRLQDKVKNAPFMRQELELTPHA